MKPFAPEVPCHRVVKSNGELGSFADDLSIK
ncbi:MGMT family protein, partial [Bathymodiolus azoricus thioautotrophic gill symbiont]